MIKSNIFGIALGILYAVFLDVVVALIVDMSLYEFRILTIVLLLSCVVVGYLSQWIMENIIEPFLEDDDNSKHLRK